MDMIDVNDDLSNGYDAADKNGFRMAIRTKPDQFQLRLPPGLRERVKAYADRQGRSMNEEIVRILEREFPEPWSLEQRVAGLHGLVAMLGATDEPGALVEDLTSSLRETLQGIASGRVSGIDDETRAKVARGLDRWEEQHADLDRDAFEMSLDDEELNAVERTGKTEKF
jgi:hypothetical protein